MNYSAGRCACCNRPFTCECKTVWVNSTQFHEGCISIYPKCADGKISVLLEHILSELTDDEAKLLAYEIEKRIGRYSDI